MPFRWRGLPLPAREGEDTAARAATFFSASTSLLLVIVCSVLCGLFAAYASPYYPALLCGLATLLHAAALAHFFWWHSVQVIRVVCTFTLILLPLALDVLLGGRRHSHNISLWAGTGPVFVLLVCPCCAHALLLLWLSLAVALQVTAATLGPVPAELYLPDGGWAEGLLFFNNVGPLLLCFWYLHVCQKAVRAATGKMTDAHNMVTSVREASEAKGLFLAKISHELRTPLLGILGITEALLLEGAGPHADDLKAIHASGEYLLTLVNDVLEYERSAQGKLPATMECLSVQEVAQEVVSMQRPVTLKKGLSLTVHVPGGFPNVFADRIRTKQVLANLVTNAVKFTDSGGVAVVALRVSPCGDTNLPAQLLRCKTEEDIQRLIEHHPGSAPLERPFLPGMVASMDSDVTPTVPRPPRRSSAQPAGSVLPLPDRGETGSKLGFLRRLASSSEAFIRYASSHSIPDAQPAPAPEPALNDFVVVMVKDSGQGIRPEDQQKLFQVFSQVDETVTRKYGGSGLGLVICKTLVERMGGCIGVESAGGLGSVFWFTLPVHTAVCAAHADEPDTGEAPENLENVEELEKAVRDRMEVLVVDDTLVNCRVLERFLSFVPFVERVSVAHNGQEALDALAQNPRIKAVLMDWHMPVMDGLTCTARIRSQFGDAMIVIGVTASVLPGDAQKCLQSGMSDVIRKPFTCHVLRRTLLKCVLRQTMDGLRTPSSTSPQADARRHSSGFCRTLLRTVVRSSLGGGAPADHFPLASDSLDFAATASPRAGTSRTPLTGLRRYEVPGPAGSPVPHGLEAIP